MKRMEIWRICMLTIGLPCILMKVQGNELNLPENFPIGDVISLGNNAYSSSTFGDFTLDPGSDNRVLHQVIGPFTWTYDENSKIVTLNSEWWGPLYTTLPTESSSLGHVFPYVRSEYTGSDYFVEVSNTTPNDFYNHGKDANGAEIGWQNAIGIGLADYVNHYLAAENYVKEMQQKHHNMRVMRDQLAAMTVEPGNPNLENHRQAIIDTLNSMNTTYSRFLFHFQRTVRAWVFVRNEGGSDQQVIAAQNWVPKAAAIHDIIYAEFVGAQRTMTNEVESIFASRTKERSDIEARQAAEAAAAANSNQGSSSQSSNSGNNNFTGNTGGSTTPIVTSGDAINWKQVDIVGRASGSGIEGFSVTATLSAVNPHVGSYYGPKSWYLDLQLNGTQSWTSYLPFGTGNPITGNIWIFVPQGNGRYWGAVFEGYGNRYTIHPAGNLNYDHTNVLAGTPLAYPWQPKSGETYGWMVSTNVIWPGRNGDMRTNIILQGWP